MVNKQMFHSHDDFSQIFILSPSPFAILDKFYSMMLFNVQCFICDIAIAWFVNFGLRTFQFTTQQIFSAVDEDRLLALVEHIVYKLLLLLLILLLLLLLLLLLP